MKSILSAFSIHGRMRRTTYSLFVLVALPMIVVTSLMVLVLLLRDHPGHVLEQVQQQADPSAAHIFDPVLQMSPVIVHGMLMLGALLLLVLYVALIASSVRRLHDMNMTGGVALILVLSPWIPALVFILMGLALMVWPGSKGQNDFGADPRSCLEIEGAVGCGT